MLLLVAAPAAEGAAASPAALADAAERLSASGATLAAAQGTDGTAALVAAIGAYEAALAALRDVMVEAAAEERSLRLEIAGRREELMRLAAALQTMRGVPAAPALHPMGPLGAARAAAIIERSTPALQAEAAQAAELLAAVEAARDVQAAGMSDLASGLAALEAARNALAVRLPAETPELDASLAALVRQSDTLTALAASVAGPAAEPGPVPEGAFAWPVRGRVVLGYNEPDGGRLRRPGIVLGAPGLSLVSAPEAGSVRYAGPFLDFGYVVVLQTAPDTLVVLAGLAELSTSTGAVVGRGDLLGRLGGRNVTVEEYVMLPHAETGAGALETLYIEIRHGRGPVDPVSWFGSENGWEGDR